MRRGKEIAQGAHASSSWLADLVVQAFEPGTRSATVTLDEAAAVWITSSWRKVTVQAHSEEELAELHEAARVRGLRSHLVQDSGRTEFGGVPTLTALAMATERMRLGHMVICAGFRNPALTAKLASTIDVISGGRFELGIGAGWKEDEWRAYGYGFPTLAERMAALGDHLGVIKAMLGPGSASYDGRYASVRGAINVPKGIQPRIPIIVGGNGQRVTAGYAIRYGDELNYVFLSAAEVAERMRDVRARCETEGRDPGTLRFSMYVRDDDVRHPGQARIDAVAAYAAAGLDRIVCFPTRWSPTLRSAQRPSPRWGGGHG
jgi:alkanesulfonate monooxygenase SsuD/methylene tetrahydromethanopterin reductase-like flavin-dependent oxidoreductase (luciferase family)